MKTALIFFYVWVTAWAVQCPGQQTKMVSIPSCIFGEPRIVKISLPAEYAGNANRKYVVAYLLDAQSEEFFNYIKATIEYLTAEGYVQPLILVGVSSSNRQFEFTPVAGTEEGRKNYQKSGGADSLALNLEQEVLPLVETKFRCTGYRIGIGHSLGGTFLTYCLIKHPGLFNATIAISPNYQYDQEELVRQMSALAVTGTLSHHYLYIANGYGDTFEERFKPATERMAIELKKKNIEGLKWQVVHMDNDSHGTTAGEGVLKGLVALYREFSLPYEKMQMFLQDTQHVFIDQLKNYFAPRSKWAGIDLPFVDDINGIGYNLYYENKFAQAIEVFRWALSLYPDDVNLYDSMGEMQQAVGHSKDAIDYYTKGLHLVERQKSILNWKKYEELIKGFQKRLHSATSINK